MVRVFFSAFLLFFASQSIGMNKELAGDGEKAPLLQPLLQQPGLKENDGDASKAGTLTPSKNVCWENIKTAVTNVVCFPFRLIACPIMTGCDCCTTLCTGTPLSASCSVSGNNIYDKLHPCPCECFEKACGESRGDNVQ